MNVEEMISINDFAKLIIKISGKDIYIKIIDGLIGVRGRCSDNALVSRKLDWVTKIDLRTGIVKLYYWVLKKSTSKQSLEI